MIDIPAIKEYCKSGNYSVFLVLIAYIKMGNGLT